MLSSQTLTLNCFHANSVFPIKENIEQEFKSIINAKKSLIEKSGKGAEFTEWVSFIKQDAFQTLENQSVLVEQICNHSNALVVIGIGGSLLGAKCVYEALTHTFALCNPKKFSNKPLLFWAGHHLAQDELFELCETLEQFSPSLLVISKSGGTTEPALGFRILKQYLDTRFGKEEANKRIFAITDSSSGTLLSIAKENQYPYFSIPKGIGGRYSVFTAVGLLPLAIAGVDVVQFLQGALKAAENCIDQSNNNLENSPSLYYATIRNILYKNNFKIEALCTWTPKAKGLTEWWKQLFGESDGKNNTGIFPASAHFTTDLHSLGQYFQEGERHLFATHLRFMNESKYKINIPTSELKDGFEFLANHELSYVQQQAQTGTFLAHADGNVPTLIWEIPELNAYWLGYWMYTNMFACAVGGYARGINPFDQPGVENYKINMFALLNKPGFESKRSQINGVFRSSVPLPSLPLSMEVEYKAKSSYPLIPSQSPEGTIGNKILAPSYSPEQQKTWQKLFAKHQQLLNVKPYLCSEYQAGLKNLHFPSDRVPLLAQMSEKLQKISGWQIIRVEGLVPPQKFFALLANKVFPCTDFIRHQDELDYTPAPDTFHDQVGHLPMIVHSRFAEFFYQFGLAGCSVKTQEQLEWFNRIYWFTVEFGLINPTTHAKTNRDPNLAQIYGAGIASSCGEIVYCLSDKVKKLPFDLDVICNSQFDIHHMQDTLFEIESFDELEQKFRSWAKEKKFL